MRELRMPGLLERDDVADRRDAGHAGPEQLVDVGCSRDPSAARLFGAEAVVTGPRPVATSSTPPYELPSRRGVLRLDVDAVRAGACGRHLGPGQHLDALLLERLLQLGRDRLVFDGTSRGSSSMIVTSLPNRRKIDANSTPTAPLPMITIDFGIVASGGSLRRS